MYGLGASVHCTWTVGGDSDDEDADPDASMVPVSLDDEEVKK